MRFRTTSTAVQTLLAIVAFSAVSLGQEISFEDDIAPIFDSNCLHCHNEDEAESGLQLDSRQSMLRGGDSGLATIVPGNAKKSYLMDVVNHVDEEMAMPPDEDKIDEEDIKLLEKWINEGAVWPGQMQALVEEKSDHWSFQPIVRPEVSEHSKSPIDAFLQETLKSKELSFSKRADARTLIRRASIILTGLAPTPEEVSAFVNDTKMDEQAAYIKLIDRLMESPHFGERWSQHWLDVIRWAETNGSESNMYRKNAWLYRDYVTQAFNEDKPYDQFLFEQIAGDTVGQGIATGFLVSGPHVPIATVGQEPTARRQARADRLDEVLQTVGASALGMTIGCARCHNHKFDPISIKDYYSMTAVFEDIEFGSRFPELEKNNPRRIRGEEIEAELQELRKKLGSFGSWEEHWMAYRDIRFASVTTDAVRIQFLQKRASLDEFEVFGPDAPNRNVAIKTVGTKVVSPDKFVFNRNKGIAKINDGMYGTESWQGKSPDGDGEKPWVEFHFPEKHNINRILASSNREDFFDTAYLDKLNNGYMTPYRIEVKDKDGNWKPVAGTPQYKTLNKKNKARAAAMVRVQELIDEYYEEGPKRGFIATFIKPAKSFVLGRGSPENPRDEVYAAGLKEISGDLGLDNSADGQERRVAFANWVASDENPLTSRVAVNRIWHHVFGQGIVATTADFGKAGALPTHPQLLDWLAAELMKPTVIAQGEENEADNWSVKHLIRLMVMSDAFRQSSQPNEAGLAVDSTSTLLWRYQPKRVDAEVIRDSVLRASDCLDDTIGGQSYRIHNVKKRYAQWVVVDNYGPKTWRRMLYQERMRRVDDGMFTAFDFPDCGQVKAKRPVSTTPLQALNLMNSDFVLDQSKRIADRAMKDCGDDLEKAIERSFELLLGRPPSQQESKDCLAIAKENGLALVCRALINSNEFAFVP